MDDPKLLSNDELLGRLERFVEEERARLYSFLSWLGEADRRKLLEDRGYTSTFDYCVRRLKLSEDEAYRRIHAARAAVMRPQILSALADGQLTLSAVTKIAPFVRRFDAPDIISRAEGKSARQLDEMLAPLRPEPEKRDFVRVIAVSPSGPGLAGATPRLRVYFGFQGSIALRDALDRIRELLSHKCPKGGYDEVLLEVAREYLERHDPQKELPGRLSPVKGGSSIAAGIRRAVWARDAGRCSFVAAGDVRCETRRFLEFDHVKPRALGGEDSSANLRLLCRAHNDSERRRILGERRYAGTTWSLSGGPPGRP
jgi:hypothetical protein